jgi:hypothetical protein
MALSYVAESAAVVAASDNLILTEPSGSQSGDLLVAAITYRGAANFTLPDGWSLANDETSGNTSTGSAAIASGVLAYIVRGGSAPSYTFVRTGGDVAIGYVSTFRGAAASPLDVATGATLGSAGTTVSVSEITTTAANALVVMAAHVATNNSDASFTATDPSSWSLLTSNGTNTGADARVRIGHGTKATAGGTGTLQWTAGGSARHAISVAAFKEAPVTGSLTATDGADAAAIVGTVSVEGTFSGTDGSDVAAFAGNVLVTGAFAATDGADAGAFAGTVSSAQITGSLEGIEGADAASLSGVVRVTGSFSGTDGADAASFEGNLVVNETTGALAATDGADAASFSGAVGVSGTLEGVEGADVAAFAGDAGGATVSRSGVSRLAALNAYFVEQQERLRVHREKIAAAQEPKSEPEKVEPKRVTRRKARDTAALIAEEHLIAAQVADVSAQIASLSAELEAQRVRFEAAEERQEQTTARVAQRREIARKREEDRRIAAEQAALRKRRENDAIALLLLAA